VRIRTNDRKRLESLCRYNTRLAPSEQLVQLSLPAK